MCAAARPPGWPPPLPPHLLLQLVLAQLRHGGDAECASSHGLAGEEGLLHATPGHLLLNQGLGAHSTAAAAALDLNTCLFTAAGASIARTMAKCASSYDGFFAAGPGDQVSTPQSRLRWTYRAFDGFHWPTQSPGLVYNPVQPAGLPLR